MWDESLAYGHNVGLSHHEIQSSNMDKEFKSNQSLGPNNNNNPLFTFNNKEEVNKGDQSQLNPISHNLINQLATPGVDVYLVTEEDRIAANSRLRYTIDKTDLTRSREDRIEMTAIDLDSFQERDKQNIISIHGNEKSNR